MNPFQSLGLAVKKKKASLAVPKVPHLPFAIPSNSKGRNTLYIVINITAGKYCSVACIYEWSHFRILSADSTVKKQIVQHNKRYHRKVLLNSFHVNGHTLGILSADLKDRTTLCSIVDSTPGKYCFNCFNWNCHT